MDRQPKPSFDPVKSSGNTLDLAEKYGPIGLKAVRSACLMQRKNDCATSKPAGNYDTDLIGRLLRLAETETSGPER